MPTAGPGLQGLAGSIASEAPVLCASAAATSRRILAAILLSAGTGGAVGYLMRRSHRIAQRLTPWLLAALNVPWLPVVLGLSLTGQLTEELALAAAIAAATPKVAEAVGSSHLPYPRESAWRAVVQRAFWAVMLSEILGLNTGIGARVRLYFLFWNPGLLGTSVVTAGAIWGASELARAVLIRLARQRRPSPG